MCGIIAYIGDRQAAPILVAGLKRLEYRGYDSAGVGLAIVGADGHTNITTVKKTGKVVNLESALTSAPKSSTLGIAHTRWATHGSPSDTNAHPHVSMNGEVAVVHNGVIDNFASLRQAMILEGYKFVSETDTELFAHLVEDMKRKNPGLPLDAVVRLALQPVSSIPARKPSPLSSAHCLLPLVSQIKGAFGVCFIFKDCPDLLIGARRGSPLLLGVGDGEYFLASDASAVVEHTNVVEYLHVSGMTEN
jgi:glutamine---fructose-6-phosphate transaminase (isomerizing)